MKQEHRWVRLPEVVAHIGGSVHTVRKWVQKGLIPHGRAGRILVFDLDAVDAWVRQRGNTGRLDFPAGEERAQAPGTSRAAPIVAETRPLSDQLDQLDDALTGLGLFDTARERA